MFCIRAVTETSEPRPADPAVDSLERASSNQKKHRRLPKLVAAQARTTFGLSAAVEPSRHGQTVPAANAPERVRQKKRAQDFPENCGRSRQWQIAVAMCKRQAIAKPSENKPAAQAASFSPTSIINKDIDRFPSLPLYLL